MVIKSFLTNNKYYKAATPLKPEGLFLHSVGCCQPSASVFVKSWNREDYTRACVHAFIDANTGDVYQTLPWTTRGIHSGKTITNKTPLGVDMTEPPLSVRKSTSGAK